MSNEDCELDFALNKLEQSVHDAFTKKGFTVLRRGWPDFLIISSCGQTLGIEVKNYLDHLTPVQRQMHDALRNAGIPVYVAKRNKGGWCINELMKEIQTTETRLNYLKDHLKTIVVRGENPEIILDLPPDFKL